MHRESLLHRLKRLEHSALENKWFVAVSAVVEFVHLWALGRQIHIVCIPWWSYQHGIYPGLSPEALAFTSGRLLHLLQALHIDPSLAMSSFQNHHKGLRFRFLVYRNDDLCCHVSGLNLSNVGMIGVILKWLKSSVIPETLGSGRTMSSLCCVRFQEAPASNANISKNMAAMSGLMNLNKGPFTILHGSMRPGPKKNATTTEPDSFRKQAAYRYSSQHVFWKACWPRSPHRTAWDKL